MSESSPPPAQQSAPEPEKVTLSSELRNVGVALIVHIRSLATLAQTEITVWKQAQITRAISIASILLFAAACFVFLNVAAFCALQLIPLAPWLAALAMAALYVLCLLVAWLKFRKASSIQLLSATREELQSDLQCLESLLKPSPKPVAKSQNPEA